ncbi:hypothetical protein Taro_004666 [Colocasia esculenta]|uniref:Disease resistance RPP13-like protein 1 n=1 Tax=Colocasia esculenta TaxID=4460 RepID=A0A843TSA6_COLES|nr:hypothetical protein [Colocasia esculenta]
MLAWVRATIDDAEDMNITDESIRDWLRQLQEVADAAEDLLDEFPHEALRLGFEGDGGWTAGSVMELPRQTKKAWLLSRFRDQVRHSSPATPPHEHSAFLSCVEQRMEDIVSRFMKIKKPEQALKLDYGKEQMDAESISARRTASSVLEETRIVGRTEELAKLKQFLLSSDAEESRGSDNIDGHVSVMAIVGMGGLGKTTLAQLAYGDAQVSQHFQLKSWVCVSEDFDVIQLTKAMLYSLNVDDSGLLELDPLHQKLVEKLRGVERFLLVLDDVWEAENLNIHYWDQLTAPFRIRSANTKIIMTTRSRKVSEMVPRTSTYDLEPKSFRSFLLPGENFNISNYISQILKLLYLPSGRELASLSSTRMEHLRVLDLGGIHLDSLPKSIAHLKHLHYLRISGFSTKLPEFVGSMYHLQTLDLGRVSELPNSMSNLHNLRHLILSSRNCVRYPVGIGKLTDLQTMRGFHVSPKHNHAKLGELKDMNNIRGEFAIKGLQNLADVNEAKKACLDKKRNISSLHLQWGLTADSSPIVDEVLESLKPSVKLVSLKISSFKGPCYPSWLGDGLFSRLGTIKLQHCEKWISLPPLGQLPSLKSLSISKVRAVEYIGSEFFSGGFPWLEELTLREMHSWKSWRGVQEGECPKLKKLSIEDCEDLESLSLINLSAVEDISISSCRKLRCMPGHSLELSHLQCAKTIKIKDICGEHNLYLAFRNVHNASKAVYLGSMERMKIHSLEIEWHCRTHHRSNPLTSSIVDFPPSPLLQCSKCETLPTLSQLPLLKELYLEGVSSLKSIVLDCLLPYDDHMSEWERQATYTSIAFPDLQKLEFHDMPVWKEWLDIKEGDFPFLWKLVLKDCPRLSALPHLSPGVEELILEGCEELRSFSFSNQGLKSLTSLWNLSVTNCPNLDFSATGGLPPRLELMSLTGFPLLLAWCEGHLRMLASLIYSWVDGVQKSNVVLDEACSRGCWSAQYFVQGGSLFTLFIPSCTIAIDCFSQECTVDIPHASTCPWPLLGQTKQISVYILLFQLKVSEMVPRTSTYDLGFLSDRDTLKLFMLHAFKGRAPNLYQNLVVIGKEIARRCGGVPLAAKTVGGLLRTTDDENCELVRFSSTRMEHLRVLDLGGVHLDRLPKSIARLRHLRYLRISGSFTELPEFVGSMYHLQTLDLGQVSKLPNSMSNLHNLRHLILSSRDCVRYPVGIGKLTDLQTVPGFCVNPEHNCAKLGELKDMNNIRGKLAIKGLGNLADVNEAKKACLDKKRNISSLHLGWVHSTDDSSPIVDEVLESLKPSVKLASLQISSFKGPSYPSWLGDGSFSRLETIKLQHCKKWISLPPLGQLPSLKSLSISKARAVKYIGSEFFSGGFPRLEELTLREMVNWKSWCGAQEGDCPKLKKLSITGCGNLKSLSLINLVAVEDISIFGCHKLRCIPGHSLELSHLQHAQTIKIKDICQVRCIEAVHLSPAAPLEDEPYLYLEDVGQQEAEYILDMWSHICRLTVRRCSNLTSLPLGNQSALKYVEISECPELQITSVSPQLWQLPSLQRIDVNGIRGAKSIKIFEKLHKEFINVDQQYCKFCVSTGTQYFQILKQVQQCSNEEGGERNLYLEFRNVHNASKNVYMGSLVLDSAHLGTPRPRPVRACGPPTGGVWSPTCHPPAAGLASTQGALVKAAGCVWPEATCCSGQGPRAPASSAFSLLTPLPPFTYKYQQQHTPSVCMCVQRNTAEIAAEKGEKGRFWV